MMKKALWCCGLLLLVMTAGGCGGKQLRSPLLAEDIELRDTEVNREILALMEEYEEALSQLNLPRLRALLSEEYFENAGTTHTGDDDYGYEGILQVLETLRAHIRDMRVEILVRQVEVDERRGRAVVLYEFAYTMLYEVEGEGVWDTARDVNRMDLRRTEQGWRIVGGM